MPEQIGSRGQLPNYLIGLAAIVGQAFDFVGRLVRHQAQMPRVDRQAFVAIPLHGSTTAAVPKISGRSSSDSCAAPIKADRSITLLSPPRQTTASVRSPATSTGAIRGSSFVTLHSRGQSG